MRAQGGAKLIDYGGAAPARFDSCGRALLDAPNARPPPLGKRSYVAPEAFARGALRGGALDVWGVGVVAFALLTGSSYVITGDPIWAHLTSGRAPAVAAAWGMPSAVPPAAAAFVHRCLAREAGDRPSAADALADPWLAVAAAPPPLDASPAPAATGAIDGGA